MIGTFEREKDESQIKCRVSKNALTAKLKNNKQLNNSAPNITQNRYQYNTSTNPDPNKQMNISQLHNNKSTQNESPTTNRYTVQGPLIKNKNYTKIQ